MASSWTETRKKGKNREHLTIFVLKGSLRADNKCGRKLSLCVGISREFDLTVVRSKLGYSHYCILILQAPDAIVIYIYESVVKCDDLIRKIWTNNSTIFPNIINTINIQNQMTENNARKFNWISSISINSTNFHLNGREFPRNASNFNCDERKVSHSSESRQNEDTVKRSNFFLVCLPLSFCIHSNN